MMLRWMMGKAMVTFTSRQVEVGPLALAGELALSENATALVMFVHGSGSSRFSPRHREVAAVFQRRGMATLLFDLLSEAEACDRHKVFDIALLARRVEQAVDWVAQQPQTARVRIGLFGASTGAAAALVAAVARPGRVLAVVSRGGRPDLATDWLPRVDVPTLLIVGSADPDVLAINRAAFRLLHCVRRIEVLPGATHLFEEPAALQSVAELSANWFESYLRYGRPA
ncbi:MAG: dienelactone hydrolase family protein [Burkholderiaceae bacterium]